MLSTELLALCVTAAMIGLVHTLLAPDHYLPFIAMSRAARWSIRKTLAVTAVCGVGHVIGSIVIGAVGIGFGWALAGIEAFEGSRGSIAGWLLLGFGLAYLSWGLHRAFRRRTGGHVHHLPEGGDLFHAHEHHGRHRHASHAGQERPESLTPWILFTVFVFGPCEPLIPVLMYPAAQQSASGVLLVAAVFAFATIATMLAVVSAGVLGLRGFRWRIAPRYAHALAGLLIAACGAAVVFGL